MDTNLTITHVKQDADGLTVTIDSVGPWKLKAEWISLNSEGDHRVDAIWPEAFWSDADALDEANVCVERWLDEQQQLELEAQIRDAVSHYSGSAQEVWGGWVWMDDKHIEQTWSKRQTRSECERVVYQTVEQLGIDQAFDYAESTR